MKKVPEHRQVERKHQLRRSRRPVTKSARAGAPSPGGEKEDGVPRDQVRGRHRQARKPSRYQAGTAFVALALKAPSYKYRRRQLHGNTEDSVYPNAVPSLTEQVRPSGASFPLEARDIGAPRTECASSPPTPRLRRSTRERRPVLRYSPSELRKECAELKKLIAQQNQQIKALMERMEARDRTEKSEDSTKRKVAKRDTHLPELPQAEAMEADRIELAPSRATHLTIPQQPEPTLQTIMNMLSQISNQQAETNNQVGILTEQMGNLTSRLDNLEAKYNQVSSRMSTFDAKLKHATLLMRKSHKSALHSKPHHGTNPAKGNTTHDDEEE
ncbi:hypothetical protein HPB48_002453 [Haemaphysalis longicornis]|uniref:Uncharacterized protein n=1 Tax=Haemaphysalis longicornis TaxID=44386 RepID=A0A9J6F6N9_HAELO|nr:hypothetical protein HPB48_002453 [Haemaphysalis longicornis]